MSNTRFSDRCITIGALGVMLAVIAGAFGAHALKQHLTPTMLNTFHTAVDYQVIHSIGLILIGILSFQKPKINLKTPANLMILGIVIFSGSLFILSLTGMKWLGMITPLGGICFILSWLLLAVKYYHQTGND